MIRFIAVMPLLLIFVLANSHAAGNTYPFNGILPPAAPGPYYVIPFQAHMSGSFQQQPSIQMHTYQDIDIYHQAAPQSFIHQRPAMESQRYDR